MTDFSFLSEREEESLRIDIELAIIPVLPELVFENPLRLLEIEILEKLTTIVNSRRSRMTKRTHTWDSVLDLFMSKLKKEDVRMMFIRGFKYALRHVYKETLPKRRMVKLDHENPEIISLWEELKDFCLRHDMREIAKTQCGPITDGPNKSARKRKTANSFNDDYIKEFFGDEDVRRCWHLFIELVFSDYTCDMKCLRFNIKCCTGGHSEDCYKYWNWFKHFLQIGMFTTLGMDPAETTQRSQGFDEFEDIFEDLEVDFIK